MSSVSETPSTTVMTQGTATVWQRPQTLLMQVALVATGETIDEALDDLRGRTDRARQRLEQAQASEVIIDEPHLGDASESDLANPVAAAQRMAARMIGEQSLGGGASGAPHEPGSVKVSVRLRAKWSLAIESSDDRLRFVEQVRRGLADIGGVRPTEIPQYPAYPSQAEQLAAITARAGQPVHDPCKPQFYFVARLGEAEHQQAVVDAIAHGRSCAERIARAAGKQLGNLKSINAFQGPQLDSARQQMKMQQQMQGKDWPEEDCVVPEFVSDKDCKSRFTIAITLNYEVE